MIDLSLWDWWSITNLVLGIIVTVISFFINCYIFLWALEGWDLLDFGWLRQSLLLGEEWKESLLLIDFFGIPIGYVRNLVLAFEEAEQFDPSNEGFILWFQIVIYPLLCMGISFALILKTAEEKGKLALGDAGKVFLFLRRFLV